MMRAAETEVSFSHTRPNGEDCFTASDKMYGENIAWGYSTPRDVMKGWMTSPGHKTNILNGGYRTIGIGCLVTKKGTYWVQCFGYDDLTAVTQPANATIAYRVAKDTSTTTSLIDGSQVEATTEQEETNEETTENRNRWISDTDISEQEFQGKEDVQIRDKHHKQGDYQI